MKASLYVGLPSILERSVGDFDQLLDFLFLCEVGVLPECLILFGVEVGLPLHGPGLMARPLFFLDGKGGLLY